MVLELAAVDVGQPEPEQVGGELRAHVVADKLEVLFLHVDGASLAAKLAVRVEEVGLLVLVGGDADRMGFDKSEAVDSIAELRREA
ncbi:hypothetical protein LTR65_007151 [Meristemomyces frigidus]